MMFIYVLCILFAFIVPCIGIFAKTKKPFLYTTISIMLLFVGFLASAKLNSDWFATKDYAALLDTVAFTTSLSFFCFFLICGMNLISLYLYYRNQYKTVD